MPLLERLNCFPLVSRQDLNSAFEALLAGHIALGNTSCTRRIAKLKSLKKALFQYRQPLREALHEDFKKPFLETDMTELYPILREIKHACRNLRRWMRAHSVETPLALIGSSSKIRYESKGVVLIIAPWNFPVNLTLGPLVAAIAAGNAVVLKPSEYCPKTNAVMKKIIAEIFDHNEVRLIEGGVDVAKALVALPFHHIFFTGSPRVGKKVMAAAAQNLTSVALELGGKSPVIVDESASLKKAAARIALSKFVNAGQMCIAPDYALVQASIYDAFLQELKIRLERMYEPSPDATQDYGRMIGTHHFDNVNSMIQEAIGNGARIVVGGSRNQKERFIAPMVMTDVPNESRIMTEEIFAPVLPVVKYEQLDEAIEFINLKERPLALYMYSTRMRDVRRVLDHTRSGGVAINHSAVHYYNTALPFGGVNNSGMGRGHGFEGFKMFSNQRGVLRQWMPWSSMELFLPPYNRFKQKLADLTLRYF